MQLGYCTNVHAGADLATTQANLAEHATAVKRLVSPAQPMGIGLWLSASTAHKLVAEGQLAAFKTWLDEEGLVPFTFNGFPFGDFHQAIVKHRVYEPTWSATERLEYTTTLLECMDALLPPGMRGSISTLPLGWGTLSEEAGFLEACGAQLQTLAERLETFEQQRGRHIQVCLEPEPGCVIDTADDLLQFFEQYLLTGDQQQHQRIRRYLGVCHDICHSAVMRESQRHAVQAYDERGISIGKVQVSAAISLRLDPGQPESYGQVVEQLGQFAEDRYLHQTTILFDGQTDYEFFDDLPSAMQRGLADERASQWRIHFHVPIYRHQLGLIESTQKEIREFLLALADSDQSVEHFEAETYAWGVLPPEHQVSCLAAGIAQELSWFRELYSSTFGRNPKLK